MTRRTQSFLLVLFGGALVRLATTDVMLRYVRPVVRPWLLAAGVAVVALGLAQLVTTVRAHTDHHETLRLGWLVLAPILAILIVDPPALGAYSAQRAPLAVPADHHHHFAALTGPSPHRVTLLDFYTRVYWDSARTVTDQDVTMTGFVTERRADGFLLVRLVITCCAADAQPVQVFVRTPTIAEIPPANAWVTVIGRYSGLDQVEPTNPQLSATSVRGVAQPKNPYD